MDGNRRYTFVTKSGSFYCFSKSGTQYLYVQLPNNLSLPGKYGHRKYNWTSSLHRYTYHKSPGANFSKCPARHLLHYRHRCWQNRKNQNSTTVTPVQNRLRSTASSRNVYRNQYQALASKKL